MDLIQHSDSPRYIRLHERDTVGVVINAQGVAAGSRFADDLEAIEAIPQSHKVALRDIAAGEAVIRYGQVIGYALRDISRGAWVTEQQLRMPDAPALDKVPGAATAGAGLEPLEGYTFQGYRNDDGSVGTRNLLGVSTTVQCVAGVLEHCVKLARETLLPKYPNVDDIVPLIHSYGCGVAINAPDAVVPIRTLYNLSRNPNLGGQALVIGLGCEKLQPGQLFPDNDAMTANQSEAEWLYRLQSSENGFSGMVEHIMGLLERRLEKLNQRRRETCPASDLVVGMQCGGSDAFSGITANPALGVAADLLVRAGATVMFSENTEVRDGIHLLTPRAASAEIADALVHEMAWYDQYLARGMADRSANTTPGNKKGGLNNIVEKAMGSIAKSGSSPIAGVVPPGERVRVKGLNYCATPASDFICGTLQLAAGMNLHIFTTGRGTPYGLAMAPVIKVATRSELAERWADLIDVDAGRILSGGVTLEELGWEIFRLYLSVASGEKTWAEKHRIHNDLVLFNPAPVT
ncbi:galactarate dehydratase [Parahaliea maris]|uniref:Galactarate dehydratase n=1 Tax=Parahaliea maris TaxID=2716870 RepID=A0A5C8ZRN9_9GAMM|nr:galactarate dehydratase [Parahaliea maris]TXS90242.1 galactarate dehydratase [Parahaliea maris]